MAVFIFPKLIWPPRPYDLILLHFSCVDMLIIRYILAIHKQLILKQGIERIVIVTEPKICKIVLQKLEKS